MTIEAYKNSYDTLGIALSGCYAQEKTEHYGYARISIPDKRLHAYYGDLKEGGIVIDKRTVDETKLINGVVSGPMMDLSLPSKTKKGWNGNESCEDPEVCGSLDMISLDLYLAFWRARNAKIGIRRGNIIQWENGEASKIVPAEERYKNW